MIADNHINFLHDGTPLHEIMFLGRIKGVNKFKNLNRHNKVAIKVLLISSGIICGVIGFIGGGIGTPWYYVLIIALIIGFITRNIKKAIQPTYIDTLKEIMNENCT